LTTASAPSTARVTDGDVADIGLHDLDLADIAQHPHPVGQVGIAHRHPHAMARLGERAYDLAADEAGAAEHRDQTLHNQPRPKPVSRGIDDREANRNEMRN
jgi:hypothetical protein